MFILNMAEILNLKYAVCTSNLCEPEANVINSSKHSVTHSFFLLLALYDVIEREDP